MSSSSEDSGDEVHQEKNQTNPGQLAPTEQHHHSKANEQQQHDPAKSDASTGAPTKQKRKHIVPHMGNAIAKITAIPHSELPLKSGRASRSSSSRFLDSSLPKERLERLPPLKSCAQEETEELIVKKLRQCRALFDFTKSLSDVQQKEIKREALLELVDFFVSERGFLTAQIYKEVFDMISVNLFRPLPPHVNPSGAEYDPEEDEPILEAAWPHIQIVYELFLRFVEQPEFNANIAKAAVTKQFIMQLVELFDSEDPRERDYLKTTLHRIYGKFLPLRSFIRKSIKAVFVSFVYEVGKHNGIAELLEILGSIINGFTLPLKPEHADFLFKGLLPLHKPKSLGLYHAQLTYCITQYLEKDPGLTKEVFDHLLRMWPAVNSAKELLFLSEVEEILSSMESQQFVQIQVPLFHRFSKCLSCAHFQVVEKTLAMWNNEYIFNLICDSLEILLPIVFAPLYYNSKHHWNKSVRPMAWYALKMFMECDPDVFHAAVRQFKEQRAQARVKAQTRTDKWAEIYARAENQEHGERSSLSASSTSSVIIYGTSSSGPSAPGSQATTPTHSMTSVGPGAGSETPRPRRLSVDLNNVSITALYNQHQPLLSAADQQTQASMMRLGEDDFSLEDPEIQALTQVKAPRARRKSLLPMDPQAVTAIRQHISLEEIDRQRHEMNAAIDSEGDIEDEFRMMRRPAGAAGSDEDDDDDDDLGEDLGDSFSDSDSDSFSQGDSDEYGLTDSGSDTEATPSADRELTSKHDGADDETGSVRIRPSAGSDDDDNENTDDDSTEED